MRNNMPSKSKTEEIEEFLLACNALENCKYVVSDSKLRELFKTFADSRYLYGMIANVLYGFNYAQAFNESVANGIFELPRDAKKAVALVFRLLWDIDAGKTPFGAFLETYYRGVDLSDAFELFCSEVIKPFKMYCCMLLSASDTTVAKAADPAARTAQSGEYTDTKGAVRPVSGARSDALNCITALAEIGNSILTGAIDRDEYGICLKGLVRALNGDSYEDIVSSLLGVKYATAYFFRASAEVAEIYKKLAYDIKHLNDK